MDGYLAWVSALIFGLAATSGYALTWLARIVAPQIGLVDHPDRRRKLHGQPMPLMGGLAVYASLLLAAFLMRSAYFAGTADVAASSHLLISAACFCLLGLIDDKLVLRARTKFLGQILASVPFVLGTHQIDSVQVLGVELQLGMFGTVFTVLWLVACANIVNLMDGLDGLASTIGFVVAVAIAVLSFMNGNTATALLSIAVAGSVSGFLFHNWPPARIFLGDAGSLTIGFLLGALAFEASVKTVAVFTLTVPAVVLSVPAFDTLMAILRRKLNGRGIGEGDRGHIHHRLLDRGLTKLQTLLAIGGLCLAMAITAIAAAYVQSDLIAIVACLAVLAMVIASRMFGYHEMLLVFRHIEALTGLFLETVGLVGTRFLLARMEDGDSEHKQNLWDDVCRRMAALGVASLEVAYRGEPGEAPVVQRRWLANSAHESAHLSTWNLEYTMTRNDGWIVTVTGTGRSADEHRLPRADDLFRLFHAVCEHGAAAPQPVALDFVPFVVSGGLDEMDAPRTVPASNRKKSRRAA